MTLSLLNNCLRKYSIDGRFEKEILHKGKQAYLFSDNLMSSLVCWVQAVECVRTRGHRLLKNLESLPNDLEASPLSFCLSAPALLPPAFHSHFLLILLTTVYSKPLPSTPVLKQEFLMSRSSSRLENCNLTPSEQLIVCCQSSLNANI